VVVIMPELNPRITVEPGKMGGKPCIRGLRFTVYDLVSYLAAGKGGFPGSLRILRQPSRKGCGS
jgi:hypothetical protein